MSREIKFRAWDNECKVIREYDELKGLTLDALDASDVELEQYTGLKDKNGKEIYEGDILAWHSNIYRKHDWVGLVLYRGAGFAVQESDKSYSSPEWLDCACRKDANIVEIVGNVHEDKDLLEADK
ncbi:YopX family protein [uncultured Lentilactobacillus sp.]|uniref:YopX family protein n=1 Tax=uncultured Lentilactobacillus sp. TaxID=2805375 RepID=UPI0025963DD0|nr:YopX family protein [uncultured Lentilactobacillus sp.]